MIQHSKICLATITSEAYFSKTKVMLNSFNLHNQFFNITKVLIVEEKTKSLIDEFKEFSNIEYKEVSIKLINAINNQKKHNVFLKEKYYRLFFFEIFNLKYFDIVLYFDSDILFINKIYGVFDKLKDFDIIFCYDTEKYWNKNREKYTYKPVYDFYKTNALQKNVNTGFAFYKNSDNNFYDKAIEFIDNKNNWETIKCNILDEYVMNNLKHYLSYHIVSSAYNYRPHLNYEIKKKDSITFEKACAIHFYNDYYPENYKKTKLFLQTSTISFRIVKMFFSFDFTSKTILFSPSKIEFLKLYIYSKMSYPRIIFRRKKQELLYLFHLIIFKLKNNE